MTSIPAASGIYKITCTVTGKFYIGSSSNLRARLKDHRNCLRRNEHPNQKLQNAWNKYGEPSFTFEVIELVLPIFVLEREQYWFEKLKPFGKNGFNIDRIAGSRMGYQPSPETIEKLRTSHLGKTLSNEAKRKLSESSTGRTHRPESIEKCRIAKLGHTVSEDARAKISATKTGHTYTPEIYAGRMKTLIVTSPDGTEYVVTGLRKFCKEHHLDVSSLMRTAKGFDRGTACTQHKGWKARFPD